MEFNCIGKLLSLAHCLITPVLFGGVRLSLQVLPCRLHDNSSFKNLHLLYKTRSLLEPAELVYQLSYLPVIFEYSQLLSVCLSVLHNNNTGSSRCRIVLGVSDRPPVCTCVFYFVVSDQRSSFERIPWLPGCDAARTV